MVINNVAHGLWVTTKSGPPVETLRLFGKDGRDTVTLKETSSGHRKTLGCSGVG